MELALARLQTARTGGHRGTLAITGSKGGIGKTNLVVNLAVALARLGRQVLVVDGDLGLANVDVMLGLDPKRNLDDLLRGKAELSEILVEGPEGIRVLPAASGIPALAHVGGEVRQRLLALLADSCDLVDHVLVDTGSGLGETTRVLQLAAERVLLVTTPEPTSLLDAYATLKVIWGSDPEKPVDVVVNASEDEADARAAYDQIAQAAAHFLGMKPGWLGPVHRDPRIPEAVRRQQAVLELFPESTAARCYADLARRLTRGPGATPTPIEFFERLMPPRHEELGH